MKLAALSAFVVALFGSAVALADEPPEDDRPLAPTTASEEPADPPVISYRPRPPVVVYMPPPPVRDPPALALREERSDLKLHAFGADVSVGALNFQPDLSRTTFSGSGVLVGTTDRVDFVHLGRDLGVASPTFWGGELQLHYLRRYLALGLVGFVAGTTGSEGAGQRYLPFATQVNPGTLMAYGGALDIAAAIPLGDHVAVGVGPLVGLRFYAMDLVGFQAATCHSKRGAYPCSESARTSAQPFLEARLRLELTPGSKPGFFFGAYAGNDMFGGAVRPTAGFFVGLHAAHASLAP
jgi:hypothetical protein